MVDAMFLVPAAAWLPDAAAEILVNPGADLAEDVSIPSVCLPADVARFPVVVCD